MKEILYRFHAVNPKTKQHIVVQDLPMNQVIKTLFHHFENQILTEHEFVSFIGTCSTMCGRVDDIVGFNELLDFIQNEKILDKLRNTDINSIIKNLFCGG